MVQAKDLPEKQQFDSRILKTIFYIYGQEGRSPETTTCVHLITFCMKPLVFFFLFYLFCTGAAAQGVKTNEYDQFLKKQRIEWTPLVLSGVGGQTRLSLSLSAEGTALFLTLDGAGWGAGTVDAGNELILLFANDSTATLKATSLQSFEPGLLQNSYHHKYAIPADGLRALEQYELTGMRKYSFASFSDLKIPKENRVPLKEMALGFAAELQQQKPVKTLQSISLKEIRNHIGDSVRFCTKVYNTRHFQSSSGGPTLLDVQADFSDPLANVVILENDRSQFNNVPELRYRQKEVCIAGRVEMLNSIPTVVLRKKEQIVLKDPLRIEDVGLFEGDTVTVSGRVFTADRQVDSTGKTTCLRMLAPETDSALSLLITGNDRPGFDTPEADYLFKSIQARGRVEKQQNQWTIFLHNSRQIQVLEEDSSVALAAVQAYRAKKARLAAQKRTEPQTEGTAETTAEFPGGHAGFLAFLERNMENPVELKPTEQKRVLVSFLIDEEGVCRDIRMLESPGNAYEQEVRLVLSKMPKWKPATLQGIAVSRRLTLPLAFKGEDSEKGKFQ